MNKFPVVLTFGVLMITFAPHIGNCLTCYKCSWADPNCSDEKFASSAPTTECGAAQAANPAGEATTPAGEATAAAFKKVKTFANETEGSSGKFFCFKVAVTNGTTKSMERGCKATEKVDDCLTLDKTVTPDAKLEACIVCSTDKCNGKSSGYLIQPSPSMAAMIAVIILTKIFQGSDQYRKTMFC
ncbi:uncharacterized protein LOC126897573 isoform X2 [Daktulosphaira vitifoliae]|uniref:uncharacterized protein LOC126897573 isoform X2 n=1 Tax=Daktulosphaira vitifoliae TaxID=58002 RepID=UPI0021A982DF|nr:uncharacterized protein LOC126897573 isoform X2 [Daktulosphaira vitifoliae]